MVLVRPAFWAAIWFSGSGGSLGMRISFYPALLVLAKILLRGVNWFICPVLIIVKVGYL
jgi:hypothetical protein